MNITRRNLMLAGAGALAAGASLVTPASAAAAVDYPGAEWIPASPSNYTVSNRPSTYPINVVVIHVTQEYYADAVAIFQNPARKVSSHYLVRSGDGHIAQLVREKDVGWHAGNWNYNTRSIGIEHEGWVDQPQWFTTQMYAASAALVRHICAKYGIPRDRGHIIGHNEVPGATHTDPGPLWDWTRYMRLINN
ncbi:N-acetylmuramoyl-L-alanine amidase [Kibdelosporangium aridum]|uniref:N-acetylmuramoyl-L-alanine amidase n=1 Tax=Kibdelosporangium aridum TaxID=2030 RepID=A0A1W2G078_KIBAR|nr:peptidoglycan recognition family protein [Kibdelosporangium aridum]SMD27580.1 N-acetylmuramoyl-L-alanine amidase [Kibdelosporangium aridum]